MINTGLEYILSTYEEGRPNKRLLLNTIFYYFIIAGVLIIGSFYIYNTDWKIDMSFFTYIPHMFFAFGILLIILGIRYLRPEKIIIRDQGIEVNIGKKKKIASWSDVIEIKNMYVISVIYIGRVHFNSAISIKTNNWKYVIKLQ